MTRFIPVFMLFACLGCSQPADCKAGIDEGDQFKVTILQLTEAVGAECNDPHPRFEVGESFTITAGRLFIDPDECETRSAAPPPPERWASDLTNCQGTSHQLGLDCSWDDGCLGGASFQFGPHIFRDTQRIDNGSMLSVWGRQTCNETTGGGCLERFDVSIERL